MHCDVKGTAKKKTHVQKIYFQKDFQNNSSLNKIVFIQYVILPGCDSYVMINCTVVFRHLVGSNVYS